LHEAAAERPPSASVDADRRERVRQAVAGALGHEHDRLPSGDQLGSLPYARRRRPLPSARLTETAEALVGLVTKRRRDPSGDGTGPELTMFGVRLRFRRFPPAAGAA